MGVESRIGNGRMYSVGGMLGKVGNGTMVTSEDGRHE